MPKKKGGSGKPETCEQITELLADYVNGKLTPTMRRSFESHLSICPDCVSFLNTYRKTLRATGELSADRLPAKVRDNVLAFLRAKIRRTGP